MEKMLNTQILEAIENGDLNALIRLVDDDDALRNMPNAFGSWLHCACREGQLQIVRYLVENGADVNLVTDDVLGHGGPVEAAVSGGHLEIVKYLLSQGASLDVATPNRNPIFTGINRGNPNAVKYLLDAGIDPHATYRIPTGELRNAFSFALERDERDIANLLSKAGCRRPIEGVDKPVWEAEQVKVEATPEDKMHDQIIARMAKVFARPVDPLSMQEIFPLHPDVHVAINVIPAGDTGLYTTIFTTGMSDLPMQAPEGQEKYQYAELIMHLPSDWPHLRSKGAGLDILWPCLALRQAAYYPHMNNTWLGGRMAIISPDDPLIPLGPNTKQTCLLLVADINSDWSPLVVEGKEIHFYTVTPIYTEERDFEKEHGMIPLIQRLDERGFTAMVDVNRDNVAIE